MSHKSARVAAVIESCQGKPLDAHYLAFFECFNEGLYFEAHEVLEELWLPERGGPKDLFYKGLIQLAGAFVHLNKERRQPAMALLRLADSNLRRYPAVYELLDVAQVRVEITNWLRRLGAPECEGGPSSQPPFPKLTLEEF